MTDAPREARRADQGHQGTWEGTDERELVEPVHDSAATQRAQELFVAADVDLEAQQLERTRRPGLDGVDEVVGVGVTGAVERAAGRREHEHAREPDLARIPWEDARARRVTELEPPRLVGPPVELGARVGERAIDGAHGVCREQPPQRDLDARERERTRSPVARLPKISKLQEHLPVTRGLWRPAC